MMNIKTIIIALIVLSGLQTKAQPFNHFVIDSKTNTNILIDYCDIEGLQKDDYGTYFEKYYNDYKPSKSSLKKLKKKLDNFEITIVLGAWCSDSKREVPRFIKVLDDAGYDNNRVKIIAVDRNKKANLVDVSELDIQRVPIFIVYEDNKEVGRIIETPHKSLEKDLWKIIK